MVIYVDGTPHRRLSLRTRDILFRFANATISNATSISFSEDTERTCELLGIRSTTHFCDSQAHFWLASDLIESVYEAIRSVCLALSDIVWVRIAKRHLPVQCGVVVAFSSAAVPSLSRGTGRKEGLVADVSMLCCPASTAYHSSHTFIGV
jgi:hypothetical protein